MLTERLLKNYKAQNPRKYAQKYGDKTINEILASIPQTPPKQRIATITPKEALPVTFETLEPEVPKKKAGRPKKVTKE